MQPSVRSDAMGDIADRELSDPQNAGNRSLDKPVESREIGSGGEHELGGLKPRRCFPEHFVRHRMNRLMRVTL
jgi:hypothetical protein